MRSPPPHAPAAGALTGACYDLALEARVDGAADEYRFAAADGVCSKQSFRTPELLLADVLWDETGVDRLLVPEANYGVVGVLLAARCESVAMTESNARAAHLCEVNCRRNGVDASVSLATGVSTLAASGDDAGSDGVRRDSAEFGAVALAPEFDAFAFAPKPYAPIDVTAQRIVDAAERVDSGGSVYLAASEQTGLARYEAVLDDVTTALEHVEERGEYSVVRASLDDALECGVPSFVSPRTVEASVDGVDLSFVSVPGVFSANRLDDGTRLLAETAPVADGDRVLDLCCGNGALGTYAASVADCHVVLTDVDRVATACAERTLDAAGDDGSVVTADGVRGVRDESFDRVLCNPPTHATDRVLGDLFDRCRRVLAPTGDVFVVHHRDLDLRPQLSVFESVQRHATAAEHVVVRAE
ncbi:MAG: methyltransferase [Halobacterium sp.]